jgi:periplasmic divalent cation tolerance protein
MAESEQPQAGEDAMDGGSGSIVLVYCPCPDVEAATRLGHGLLDRHLAGCINILPGMMSLYDWQGAREETGEAVMLVKTRRDLAGEVRSFLEREHPYDVPAILRLDVADVSAGYGDWLLGQCPESGSKRPERPLAAAR